MTGQPVPRDPAEVADPVAPRRATMLTLTGGALLGAICFAVAVVADLAGLGRDGQVEAVDTSVSLEAMLGLEPWAWALLGTTVIIATPAVGLVVTAIEFEAIADRRAALMAFAVLIVLGISFLVALRS